MAVDDEGWMDENERDILISFRAVEDGAQADVVTILRGGDSTDNFNGSNLSSAHLAKPLPLIFQPHFQLFQLEMKILAV